MEMLRGPTIPFTGGMIVFDTAITMVAAYAVSKWVNVGFWTVLAILILLSIVLHKLFDVATMTNYYLGLSNKPLRDAKK